MCASKRFGKFAVLFLFLLTSLGSSIPVSAEAEEEPEVLTAIASADVFFSGFLIAEGDTLELEESQYYLEDAVSYLIAYNEDGGEALLLAEISGWEAVDIQTAGSYTVTVHLCIDDSDRDAANYVLAPELENISIPVCISQPEAFDLFCARATAFMPIPASSPVTMLSWTTVHGHCATTKWHRFARTAFSSIEIVCRKSGIPIFMCRPKMPVRSTSAFSKTAVRPR